MSVGKDNHDHIWIRMLNGLLAHLLAKFLTANCLFP